MTKDEMKRARRDQAWAVLRGEADMPAYPIEDEFPEELAQADAQLGQARKEQGPSSPRVEGAMPTVDQLRVRAHLRKVREWDAAHRLPNPAAFVSPSPDPGDVSEEPPLDELDPAKHPPASVTFSAAMGVV